MASKFQHFFENIFNRLKNSATTEEKSSAAAFEREGHFWRRHSERMVIVITKMFIQPTV